VTPERWARFSFDQQILSIAAEMVRAGRLGGEADGSRRAGSYERVLRLVELTVETNPRRGLRRELLRWRDLVAQLYLQAEHRPDEHEQSLRCLLRFSGPASEQIQHLLP
jgi:hypothetical protein